VLHFVIIQRTKSTPHDYKICDAFLSRLCLAGEFELFTKPSKSDFLKPKIPSAKFQTGFLQNGGKAIVFLFGILNFGHCYLEVTLTQLHRERIQKL